jgi:signal transduction histidine kinase
MMKSQFNLSAWPVLAVLVVGVLVPAGCILWFMNAAMTSERLAVRQRLTDVYQGYMADVQKRFEAHWSRAQQDLDRVSARSSAERFNLAVLSGIADSVIILDASGAPAYPTLGRASAPPNLSPAVLPPSWTEAQQLEEQGGQFREAAAAYAAIAQGGQGANLRALALQAQTRCLLRGGQREQAIEVLRRLSAAPELRAAADPEGRLIVPAAQLLLLQLSGDPAGPDARAIAATLAAEVNDYSTLMPSGQRLFLMESLAPYFAADVFPTREAERLAAACIEASGLDKVRPGRVRPAGVADLWLLPSTDGRTVGIYTSRRVAEPAALQENPPGATLVIDWGGSMGLPDSAPFLRVQAGRFFPNSRVDLVLAQPDPFLAASARQNAVYLWTAGAGILMVTLLAVAVAGYLRRQVHLARLKNDFVATVSHELKTPLASMRLLVDTVLEGRTRDAAQAQEYLRLISRENERLTRLIDNFLTFSRMERNKRAFEFRRVDVADIVEAARAAVGDRFNSPQSLLECDVPPDLPAVYGDRDVLITVLVNLLDNAWKYSGDVKRVRVRARADGDAVLVEVADKGIGLARRAQRRIFERFYQVDSSLTRRSGGCGLGLAIVKFILDAHGAAVSVVSQPGQGSTFTVRLPLDRPDAAPAREESPHAP